MPTRIVVLGAAGRMGRRIIALSQETGTFTVTGAVEHSESPALGQDAGTQAQIAALDLPITSDLAPAAEDIIIDFTQPHVLPQTLAAAKKAGCGVVCGTTGLEDDGLTLLEDAAKEIPVLYSPNMSLGVNIMFLIARQMAKMLPEAFDIEVLEMHHKHKRDAPSGTALRLAEMLAEGRELSLKEVARMSREGGDVARQTDEIGLQSLRGGDVAGEHTAFFAGPGERLELTHRATSRDIFARGALRAAAWLDGKAPGLYSMFDVLDFA